MRDIDEIICSCGSKPVEDDVTFDESKAYGCGRDIVKPYGGCCVDAYKCPKCNTRWLFKLEAPEME